MTKGNNHINTEDEGLDDIFYVEPERHLTQDYNLKKGRTIVFEFNDEFIWFKSNGKESLRVQVANALIKYIKTVFPSISEDTVEELVDSLLKNESFLEKLKIMNAKALLPYALQIIVEQ